VPKHLRLVPAGAAPVADAAPSGPAPAPIEPGDEALDDSDLVAELEGDLADLAGPAVPGETSGATGTAGGGAPLAALAIDDRLDVAFRQYSRYVANLAYRLLGRDDEVDDVVQDVFMAAVRGLGRLQNAQAVRAWLATVTTRIARRRLRMRRLRTFLGFDETSEYDQMTQTGVSPEQAALLARVYAQLDRLPVNQRLAWTLRYVEGEQLEEVAVHCGCSLATAKRRISAAQVELDRVLRSPEDSGAGAGGRRGE
jgi:RNA polymerase sigma-70 factor (ECF subfamily)